MKTQMKHHPKHNFENSEIDLIELRLAQISRSIRELLEPSSGITWEDTVFNGVAQFTQNINEHWNTSLIDKSISNAIRHSGLDVAVIASVMTRAGIKLSEFQLLTELINKRKSNAVYKRTARKQSH